MWQIKPAKASKILNNLQTPVNALGGKDETDGFRPRQRSGRNLQTWILKKARMGGRFMRHRHISRRIEKIVGCLAVLTQSFKALS